MWAPSANRATIILKPLTSFTTPTRAPSNCGAWNMTSRLPKRRSWTQACPRAWPSASPSADKLKILILKPSSLGDEVQSLPVLRLIKRHLPASEIYWWIDSKLAPLLEGDPDLADRKTVGSGQRGA